MCSHGTVTPLLDRCCTSCLRVASSGKPSRCRCIPLMHDPAISDPLCQNDGYQLLSPSVGGILRSAAGPLAISCSCRRPLVARRLGISRVSCADGLELVSISQSSPRSTIFSVRPDLLKLKRLGNRRSASSFDVPALCTRIDLCANARCNDGKRLKDRTIHARRLGLRRLFFGVALM